MSPLKAGLAVGTATLDETSHPMSPPASHTSSLSSNRWICLRRCIVSVHGGLHRAEKGRGLVISAVARLHSTISKLSINKIKFSKRENR